MTNSNLSQPDSRKQVKSEGAELKRWLQDAGVVPGRFFQDAKDRVETMAKDSRFTDTARVMFSLSLHTMAYGEALASGPGRPLVAVTMNQGTLAPWHTADIAKETGIEPRRRGLVR